jgi:hypothetical protein
MNSLEFLEQIKTLSDQYKIWFKPVEKFSNAYIAEHNIIINNMVFLFKAVEEFTNKQRSENDLPGRINSFLDNNYTVYLESSPEICEKIRGTFYGDRNFENFLFTYTRRAVSELLATGEESWLSRGLASTSLENCGIDYRDTLVCLAELFVTAENQGIDPKTSFLKVAEISSHYKPRGGSTPVSEMMKNFENYPILIERRNMKTSYWSKVP